MNATKFINYSYPTESWLRGPGFSFQLNSYSSGEAENKKQSGAQGSGEG